METTKEITNSEDVIDSRDVIARIEEIQESLPKNAGEVMPGDGPELDALREELKALLDLQEELHGSPDWEYGEALIRDSYFKEYAQGLASDCGMIQSDMKWPCTCIDWDQAAQDLQMDYTSVEFDGIDYWIRS